MHNSINHVQPDLPDTGAIRFFITPLLIAALIIGGLTSPQSASAEETCVLPENIQANGPGIVTLDEFPGATTLIEKRTRLADTPSGREQHYTNMEGPTSKWSSEVFVSYSPVVTFTGVAFEAVKPFAIDVELGSTFSVVVLDLQPWDTMTVWAEGHRDDPAYHLQDVTHMTDTHTFIANYAGTYWITSERSPSMGDDKVGGSIAFHPPCIEGPEPETTVVVGETPIVPEPTDVPPTTQPTATVAPTNPPPATPVPTETDVPSLPTAEPTDPPVENTATPIATQPGPDPTPVPEVTPVEITPPEECTVKITPEIIYLGTGEGVGDFSIGPVEDVQMGDVISIEAFSSENVALDYIMINSERYDAFQINYLVDVCNVVVQVFFVRSPTSLDLENEPGANERNRILLPIIAYDDGPITMGH